MDIRSLFRQLMPAQPCFLCGAMNRAGLCCNACAADLPHLSGPRCRLCAQPLPTDGVCGHCLRHAPAFDRTLAAFRYAFPLDRLVQALKFEEQLLLAPFLGDALARCVDETPDCLLALPLHADRLRARAFNQSQLLADHLSRALHLPVRRDVVQRVRNTLPQSSLPWQARKRNMRQAFALQPGAGVHGMHIAIVDDVMTTGATLDALAHVLKQGGARKVSAWVVARTLARA